MHTFSLIKQTQGEADRFEIIRNWAESDLCCHFKQRCELFCVPNEPLHLAEFGFKVLRHRNSVYWVFQSQSPCYITLEMVQWRNMAEKYSVQFSRSVMSDSLRLHEPQNTRPPCPSIPVVYSNSSPLSRWCHPTIPSSVVPFSSSPQSLPASGSFHMSQLYPSGAKYWSFSFSISPSNEHPGLISFRMDWLELLAVQGTLKSLLQHHSSKASILRCSASFTQSNSHIHTWPLEKP